MQKILLLTVLAVTLALQGCQTTKTQICEVCHPEEAAQASADAAPRKNPIKQLDSWIQEHMW